MGVNLFVPINAADATPANIEQIINSAMLLAHEWAEEAFDWCDVFKGDGGYLFTMQQALGFTEEEAPWFVLTALVPDGCTIDGIVGGELLWCHPEAKYGNPQTGMADWRNALKISGGDSVLFLKARN